MRQFFIALVCAAEAGVSRRTTDILDGVHSPPVTMVPRNSRLMALLQISEPGQSPEPHQARLAVGIDLGTTNSLIGTVRSGMPVVLPDAQGRPLLPSIVRYHADGRVDVGYAAQARQAEDRRTRSSR